MPADTKAAAISVVVTRADGTVEDLGVVAYHHSNPLKRLAYRIRRLRGEHIDPDTILE